MSSAEISYADSTPAFLRFRFSSVDNRSISAFRRAAFFARSERYLCASCAIQSTNQSGIGIIGLSCKTVYVSPDGWTDPAATTYPPPPQPFKSYRVGCWPLLFVRVKFFTFVSFLNFRKLYSVCVK